MAFNRIFAVIGRRGEGKTPLIMGGDDERGMAKDYLDKNMSTIVVDMLDHPKYRSCIDVMPDKYLSHVSKHPAIYRTIASSEEDMHHLMKELKNVWNSLMVLEDAYKYNGDTLSRPVRQLIGDSKQKNVDIVYMTSCWAWCPPDLIKQADYFVIFKTADSPEVRKKDLGGCFPEVLAAHQKVMAGKSRYLIVNGV